MASGSGASEVIASWVASGAELLSSSVVFSLAGAAAAPECPVLAAIGSGGLRGAHFGSLGIDFASFGSRIDSSTATSAASAAGTGSFSRSTEANGTAAIASGAGGAMTGAGIEEEAATEEDAGIERIALAGFNGAGAAAACGLASFFFSNPLATR